MTRTIASREAPSFPVWIEASLALLESYRSYGRFRGLNSLPLDEPRPSVRFTSLADLKDRPDPIPEFHVLVMRHLADLGPERLGFLEQLYQYGRGRIQGERASLRSYEREVGTRELAAYLAGKTNAVECIRKALTYSDALGAVERLEAPRS